jgi:hypothetical protein
MWVDFGSSQRRSATITIRTFLPVNERCRPACDHCVRLSTQTQIMTKIRNDTKISAACANVVTPKIGSNKQSNPTGAIHCLEASCSSFSFAVSV